MDDVDLTLAEASEILDPPLSEAQLHAIIHALPGLTPAGARHNGRPGRPETTYPAADLLKLHAALAPWLVTHGN